MKQFLFAMGILHGLLAQPKEKPKSIWKHKIAPNCMNTLKLYSFGKATEYDCEMDYIFQCNYKISKDTLKLTIRDDSHSEDGGKVIYYKEKFIVGKSFLSSTDGKHYYKRMLN